MTGRHYLLGSLLLAILIVGWTWILRDAYQVSDDEYTRIMIKIIDGDSRVSLLLIPDHSGAMVSFQASSLGRKTMGKTYVRMDKDTFSALVDSVVRTHKDRGSGHKGHVVVNTKARSHVVPFHDPLTREEGAFLQETIKRIDGEPTSSLPDWIPRLVTSWRVETHPDMK